MQQVDTYQCLVCKQGFMVFVRLWLGREIRQCDLCQTWFSFPIGGKNA